jgi:hypothetical protein
MVLTGVLWVAGGLPTTRRGPGLWVVALPLDYTARLHGFSVPGLGRSRTGEWTIEGGHLAERCQLFVIVAPGASPSCSPAPRLPTWTRRRGAVTAFVVAFAGSLGAVVDLLRSRGSARKRCDRGRRRPGPPGTLGLHLLPCADGGWDHRTAVADELTIAHPGGYVTAATAARSPRRPSPSPGATPCSKTVFAHWSWSRTVAIAVLAVTHHVVAQAIGIGSVEQPATAGGRTQPVTSAVVVTYPHPPGAPRRAGGPSLAVALRSAPAPGVHTSGSARPRSDATVPAHTSRAP